jgi:hypothetical protein
MAKRLPQVGDKVTCKLAEPAYYSNYGGNPVMIFKPGMVGTVATIAPKVRKVKGPGCDGKDDFLVVDYHAPETNATQRVGLNFCNAEVVA